VQNKDYHSLFECLGVLLVPQALVTPFCRQFDNNFDKLWRGYKTFRPRLTKYCRGCVTGGVDAYVGYSNSVPVYTGYLHRHRQHLQAPTHAAMMRDVAVTDGGATSNVTYWTCYAAFHSSRELVFTSSRPVKKRSIDVVIS